MTDTNDASGAKARRAAQLAKLHALAKEQAEIDHRFDPAGARDRSAAVAALMHQLRKPT